MRIVYFVLIIHSFVIFPAFAKDWYTAPGAPLFADAVRSDPIDLNYLLQSKSPVRPDDRIILLEGTYKYSDRSRTSLGYRVFLSGQQGHPITIMGEYRKRITIDGGIRIEPRTQYLIMKDLEIIVSENFIPQNRIAKNPGSQPVDRQWPWGGLQIRGGVESRFINLVIHDNSNGIGFFKESINSEIYGCIIYNNGWSAPDRKHGHAIYCQNNEGYKVIQDCIMTGGYGYTMHGWVQRPDHFANNIKLEGNMVYNSNNFLVGGLNPSKNILLMDNYLYHNKRADLGYRDYKGRNKNCTVIGNLFVETPFYINNFDEVSRQGNIELKSGQSIADKEYTVILKKNKYDPNRANIAVFNWKHVSSVPLDLSSLGNAGDRYRLMNPTDFFGEPVFEGTYQGDPVLVKTDGTFAAFVLLFERENAS